MNFLELCVKGSEAASLPGDGPSSVVAQTGMYGKLVTWVNQAWLDIQRYRPNWLWMHDTATITTIAGIQEYSISSIGLTNFGVWDVDRASIYLSSIADEGALTYIPYDKWYALYGLGEQTTGRPSNFTVAPNRSILFNATPDDVYTARIKYFHAASDMTANTDTPGMPEQFHMAIVWRALMLYGVLNENAIEQYQIGQENYINMLSDLQLNQLPMATSSGTPLV